MYAEFVRKLKAIVKFDHPSRLSHTLLRGKLTFAPVERVDNNCQTFLSLCIASRPTNSCSPSLPLSLALLCLTRSASLLSLQFVSISITMTDIPFHPAGSYLRDAWAMKFQVTSPLEDFLYSGKAPTVGQRTETLVVDFLGQECQLSGVVAEVSQVEQWKSSVAGVDRNLREYAARIMPDTTPSIVGYSILSSVPLLDTGSPLGLKRSRVYRVEYTADESLQNVYCASRITEVPAHLMNLLPPVVIKFLVDNAALWQA
jgi:hypothetical protein